MKFQIVTAIAFATAMVAAAPIESQEQAPLVAATKSKRDIPGTGAQLQHSNQATAGLFGNGNTYGNEGVGGFIDATIDSITKTISSPIRGILAGGGSSGSGSTGGLGGLGSLLGGLRK